MVLPLILSSGQGQAQSFFKPMEELVMCVAKSVRGENASVTTNVPLHGHDQTLEEQTPSESRADQILVERDHSGSRDERSLDPVSLSTSSVTTATRSFGSRSSSNEPSHASDTATSLTSHALSKVIGESLVLDIGIMRFMCFARTPEEIEKSRASIVNKNSHDSGDSKIRIKDIYVQGKTTPSIGGSESSAFQVQTQKEECTAQLSSINVPLGHQYANQRLLEIAASAGTEEGDDDVELNCDSRNPDHGHQNDHSGTSNLRSTSVASSLTSSEGSFQLRSSRDEQIQGQGCDFKPVKTLNEPGCMANDLQKELTNMSSSCGPGISSPSFSVSKQNGLLEELFCFPNGAVNDSQGIRMLEEANKDLAILQAETFAISNKNSGGASVSPEGALHDQTGLKCQTKPPFAYGRPPMASTQISDVQRHQLQLHLDRKAYYREQRQRFFEAHLRLNTTETTSCDDQDSEQPFDCRSFDKPVVAEPPQPYQKPNKDSKISVAPTPHALYLQRKQMPRVAAVPERPLMNRSVDDPSVSSILVTGTEVSSFESEEGLLFSAHFRPTVPSFSPQDSKPTSKSAHVRTSVASMNLLGSNQDRLSGTGALPGSLQRRSDRLQFLKSLKGIRAAAPATPDSVAPAAKHNPIPDSRSTAQDTLEISSARSGNSFRTGTPASTSSIDSFAQTQSSSGSSTFTISFMKSLHELTPNVRLPTDKPNKAKNSSPIVKKQSPVLEPKRKTVPGTTAAAAKRVTQKSVGETNLKTLTASTKPNNATAVNHAFRGTTKKVLQIAPGELAQDNLEPKTTNPLPLQQRKMAYLRSAAQTSRPGGRTLDK